MKNVTQKLFLMTGLAICLACGSGGNAVDSFTHRSGQDLLDSALVPPAEAERMIANYAPRAGVVIRGTDTLPNTRSIWFGIALLEALVDEVRATGGSGIRFHLSAYSDAYPDGTGTDFTPPQEYWDYTTLLMVPTYPDGDGLQLRDGDGGKAYNRGGLIPPHGGPTLRIGNE